MLYFEELKIFHVSGWFLCHYVFSMQAVKTAMHMLENGACIEDIKSVCTPGVLFQLAKWKVHEYGGTLLLFVLHKLCFTTILLHTYSSIRWYAYTNVVVYQAC